MYFHMYMIFSRLYVHILHPSFYLFKENIRVFILFFIFYFYFYFLFFIFYFFIKENIRVFSIRARGAGVSENIAQCRQKTFSKVSFLVHTLYKGTIQSTFENVCENTHSRQKTLHSVTHILKSTLYSAFM